LFKQYRKELPEIEDGFLKTATLEAYRIATNKYTADSLMSHREEYETLAKKTTKSATGITGIYSAAADYFSYPACLSEGSH
jgi:hypothetical protein